MFGFMKSFILCIGSALTVSLLLFSGSSRAAGYDENVMHNFMGGCMKTALSNNANPGLSSRYCHCLWKYITKEIPFTQFVKLDSGEMNIKQAGFVRIITKCGGNVNRIP